jgi:hypothetical protein
MLKVSVRVRLAESVQANRAAAESLHQKATDVTPILAYRLLRQAAFMHQIVGILLQRLFKWVGRFRWWRWNLTPKTHLVEQLLERSAISTHNDPASLSGPQKSVNRFRIQRGELASSRCKPTAKSGHKGNLVFR